MKDNSSIEKDMISNVVSNIRNLEKSMRVSVEIPKEEAVRVCINELIEVRNSIVNRGSDMSHFDKVLKHYLTEDEFSEYVIGDKRF